MKRLCGILLSLAVMLGTLPGCVKKSSASSVIEQNKNLENAFTAHREIEEKENGIKKLSDLENSEKQTEKSRISESPLSDSYAH
jgi:hypothetical protein